MYLKAGERDFIKINFAWKSFITEEQVFSVLHSKMFPYYIRDYVNGDN